MILTEEQKRALKRVVAYMDEMYAIASPYYGCTEDVNILQAMIDSSEHFSDATKMIGFDMEKARASIAHYRIENPSNVDTESALKELVDQANLAEDALAEIERLQGFETAARDLNNDLIRIAGERDELAARIQELEAEVARVADFANEPKRMLVSYILELEDALVEERAKQFDVDEPCPARTHHEYCDILKKSCDGFPHTWEKCPRKQKKLDAARQHLQAEGKIGPDARPKCDHAWQAAIEERGYQTCLKCGECRNIEDIPRTAAWQITEERKAALWHAINVLKENDIMEEPEEHLWDEEVTVLQAMLTEAGQ